MYSTTRTGTFCRLTPVLNIILHQAPPLKSSWYKQPAVVSFTEGWDLVQNKPHVLLQRASTAFGVLSILHNREGNAPKALQIVQTGGTRYYFE